MLCNKLFLLLDQLTTRSAKYTAWLNSITNLLSFASTADSIGRLLFRYDGKSTSSRRTVNFKNKSKVKFKY